MKKRDLIPLAGLCLLFFLPSLLSPYWLRVIISTLFLSCLSYSHNLLFYFLGYPAFGGIAFFGFGAYVFSVLYANLSYPFFLSLLLGGFSSFLLSLSVSPAIMRLKSHYFAIATLALQLSFMELAENLDITGGTKGIVFKLTQQSNLISFYAFLFILLTLLTFTLFLEMSNFGLTMKAIKEDETTSLSVGVNTMAYKSLAFMSMAFFLGLLGGVFSFWNAYVDAPTLFNPMLSVKTFFVLTLSMSAPLFGPLLWSWVFEMTFELLWSKFLLLHGLLLGSAIVVLILLFPRGLAWKKSWKP